MRILEPIGILLLLAGCTASFALPVTSPIWFFIGLLFLSRRPLGMIWHGCTALHLFFFIALASTCFITFVQDRLQPKKELLVGGIVFSLLVILTVTVWRFTESKASEERVSQGVKIQIVVALVSFILGILIWMVQS